MNWKRANNVIWEEWDSGALLVNPDTGGRWSLNATAAAVWKLCDGRLSIQQVATRITRPIDEVTAFCRKFVELGLLRKTLAPIAGNGVTFRTAMPGAPGFKSYGLGSGPRRRPTPRGLSGPA